MNKYNKKLDKLIEEANENGYVYSNNEFKKIYKDKVDVIHLFIVSNKSDIKVYNKCLVILDKFILNKIKSISNISDIISFMRYFLYKIDGAEISKIEDFKGVKEEDLFNIDISDKENIYGENSYLETSFKNDNGLFGFLHIFRCPFSALDNFQNLKYYFKQS